jgi:hypothetical protein
MNAIYLLKIFSKNPWKKKRWSKKGIKTRDKKKVQKKPYELWRPCEALEAAAV